MAEQLALERTRAALEPVASTASIIQMAVQQGAGIDVLERLMALKEREEAAQAKRAYNEAFTAFKTESIKIIRNIEVTDGPLKGKKYADLFGVVDAICPALSKFGLSHSWNLTKDEPEWIEVTCVIRHRDGHSESVSMGAPPDRGGAKNAVQARASTISYLERYTLLASSGCASQGQDTDANGGGPRMEESVLLEWLDAIGRADDLQGLQRVYSEAYKAAQHMQDRNAMAQLVAAKDARKKVLNAAH